MLSFARVNSPIIHIEEVRLYGRTNVKLPVPTEEAASPKDEWTDVKMKCLQLIRMKNSAQGGHIYLHATDSPFEKYGMEINAIIIQ